MLVFSYSILPPVSYITMTSGNIAPLAADIGSCLELRRRMSALSTLYVYLDMCASSISAQTLFLAALFQPINGIVSVPFL